MLTIACIEWGSDSGEPPTLLLDTDTDSLCRKVVGHIEGALSDDGFNDHEDFPDDFPSPYPSGWDTAGCRKWLQKLRILSTGPWITFYGLDPVNDTDAAEPLSEIDYHEIVGNEINDDLEDTSK